MNEFQQLGYGQQPFQPQGFFGGGGGGNWAGSQQLGGQIGQPGGGFPGGTTSYGAEPQQQMQQAWGGIGQAGQQPGGAIGGQFLQQHPLLQQIMQHPVLLQQLLATHPLLQQAMQNPQAAQQLVQQHPLLQQALQHPLLAHTIMQQYPMLQQALQQQLLQQLQQIQQQQQQQQQFQQPGMGGGQMAPQGWFGGVAGQLGGGDPYSAWLQQQAMASQYRGMQPFQPGQMMGQGIQGGGQPGQVGAQTLH